MEEGRERGKKRKRKRGEYFVERGITMLYFYEVVSIFQRH